VDFQRKKIIFCHMHLLCRHGILYTSSNQNRQSTSFRKMSAISTPI
jgi:hypothetical protein